MSLEVLGDDTYATKIGTPKRPDGNPSVHTEGTALASTVRTATTNSGDLTNYDCRGVDVIIDCTADPAAASVTFTIQGKCPVSGKYYTVLASAAVAAVGTTVLRVGPGLTAAANTVANFNLPRTWRVLATHADADSITYSVGYCLIR